VSNSQSVLQLFFKAIVGQDIYLDNAGWHKSAAVKEYLDGHGGDVVLRHLPPYTPELNPVEVQ